MDEIPEIPEEFSEEESEISEEAFIASENGFEDETWSDSSEFEVDEYDEPETLDFDSSY